MKFKVCITLIICGTVLLALPYIHNMVTMQQLVKTMTELKRTVNLSGSLPGYTDFIATATGLIMIIVGTTAGLRGRSHDEDFD